MSFSKSLGAVELWSKKASHFIKMSCRRARAQFYNFDLKYSTLEPKRRNCMDTDRSLPWPERGQLA